MNGIRRVQDAKREIRFFNQETKKRRIMTMEAWKLDEKIEEIFQLMEIPSISNKYLLMLDVGCGTGRSSIRLAKKGFDVIGIDISESIKIAREQSKVEKIDVSIIRGDVTKAPFKPEAFDTCFCAQVLHHFPDLGSIVPELSRIVKHNGRIMLFEPNGSNVAFRAIEFVKEIAPKGWMVGKQMATINEAAHDVKSYSNALKSNDFITSKVLYYMSAEQALAYRKQVIKGFFQDYGILAGFLLFMRYLSLNIALNILPKHLGMGSVLMTATKYKSFSGTE